MSLAIEVWLYECCSNVPPKIALKVENRILRLLNWKMIAPHPRYEFLMNVMFKDNGSIAQKNQLTFKEETKGGFINPVVKKPSEKKQVNIVDDYTQTRTPPPCAAKAAVMKTPVSKPIPTRQASFSKMKKEKQTVRVIFSQVQSKADSHVEEVAVSKRESHVEKEAFICKKVHQEFKGVREEFTRIRKLVKKKFKKMVKAIEHSKQQHEDTGVETQQMDYAGVETSPQQFSPIVDQNLNENQDDTNEKLDDTNLSDLLFIIPDELLPSLNAYRRESITRHPLTTCEEEQSDEHFNDKKSESVVQDHCQENKENVGSSSKPDMHREVDLGTEEQIMTTLKIQELTTDEQKDEIVRPDSQDTIPDDLLPSLNAYSSKSIIVHPSANRELQTPIPKLRIRRPSKFNESPYTMEFGSAAESSEGHIRIFPQKHLFVYHPIDGIVDTKIVNKFMDWISEDLLKVHAQRYVHDVYFTDIANLTTGGQVAHLNEYINGFRMHAFVPWHTVEDIYIPVNIKKKHHWVLAILSFSGRCIFLYDSYESSGHYSAVLNVIEKLAAIIPLCLQHWIVVSIWLHMRSVFLMVTKFLRMSSTPMHSVQDTLHFCENMGPESKTQMLIVMSKHL
ncbi:uncharacterized protein LOC107871814 [Capsicum annuum]|uniref:uncharacterized protein LOC107871814 n=1 Tax=Capsicum annuum TaxID=4072 RepID=UPI001FB0F476|nr:uncharacterized protein LOC107871814 [Capsicum annuum]